jgi:EmrB/QacA subfamily drug resistance transporter
VESPQRKTTVLAVVTAGSFMIPFMSAATNVALPRLASDLSIPAPLLSWVNAAYMLAGAVVLLPMGRLVDLRGRRPTFVWGLLLFAVATALVAVAPSTPWLLGLRGLQGAVGAASFAAGTPLLVALFPPAERGRALGVTIAGVYTGLSLGPVVGGILTETWGWRSVFWVTVVLVFALHLVAAWRLPPDRPPEGRGRFDLEGSVVYAVGLCALMLGMARLPGPLGWWLLAGGVAGLLAFGAWELRSPSPVLDLRLFRHNPVFLFSNIAALVNYCATAAVGFLLSLYLQHAKGLNARQAGLVLVVQPVLMALLSPAMGRLSDRVEPRFLSSLGMAMTTVGLGLLSFLTAETPLLVVGLALALLGVAFALFSSPNTNAVMGAVEKRYLGIASATVGTMRTLGQVLSLGVTGVILAAYVGPVQVDARCVPELLASMRTAFSVFALLCLAGVLASLARGKVQRA